MYTCGRTRGNWGQDDGGDGSPLLGKGFRLPIGATQLSFYAWSAVGGETVNCKAGIDAAVGFKITTGALTLCTEPTCYVVDVTDSDAREVAGGSAMTMEWDVAPMVGS